MSNYLACEGFRIQLAFLDLAYATNTDLVMIAIDSFLVIFEESVSRQMSPERKRSRSRESKDKEKPGTYHRQRLSPQDIASLLVSEGLVSKLAALVP